MDQLELAGRKLVDLAQPYLDAGDGDALARRLAETWSPGCLVPLLDSSEPGVRETAAHGLRLIGDVTHCGALAARLHDDDSEVVRAAEDALWSIWFRAGGPMARAALTRIAESIRDHDTENVVPLLNELIRSRPNYAEAYHQRSQAHYLAGAYELSIRDARRAFHLNPHHFAALANQAHCLAALGRFQETLRTYHAVLRLHPRMEGIRPAIRRLRSMLAIAGASN